MSTVAVMHKAWASFSFLVKCFVVTSILFSAEADSPKFLRFTRPLRSSRTMSSTNTNSNNSTLVVLTATSTIAVGFSVYLWRSVARLQERIDILEAKQEQREEATRRISASPQKRVSQSDQDATASRSLASDRAHPPPEVELGPDDPVPLRFQRAGKGDEEEGRRRFLATLDWRERHEINDCLYQARPHFELIKNHYPHYFHGFGLESQPVFYERPPKTDLKALRKGGVDLKSLLKHYAMVTEFGWQYLARDDLQRSVYIIDLEGMGMYDFVGECKDFVQQASEFTSQHYPERAGVVLVINVPYWFKMVWNVVSKWVDEVTLKKIFILRGEEILETLSTKVAIENIPKEYGGESPYELGNSLEEQLIRNLMAHNNEMAETGSCPNAGFDEPCQFCNFRYARNY